MPVTQARSSPKSGPRAPAATARPATEPWPKYWRRIMSVEWPRAARTRWKSTRSVGRPLPARTAFMVLRSDVAGLERPLACASDPGSKAAKTTSKTVKNCLFVSIAAVWSWEMGGRLPRTGEMGSLLAEFGGLARCLGDRDAGESNGCAGRLQNVQRFAQPGPCDDDCEHRLEHSGDPRAARA